MKIKCIDNTDYPVSLTVGKEYDVNPFDHFEHGTVNVSDDSGESYWFPMALFAVTLDVPLDVLHFLTER